MIGQEKQPRNANWGRRDAFATERVSYVNIDMNLAGGRPTNITIILLENAMDVGSTATLSLPHGC